MMAPAWKTPQRQKKLYYIGLIVLIAGSLCLFAALNNDNALNQDSYEHSTVFFRKFSTNSVSQTTSNSDKMTIPPPPPPRVPPPTDDRIPLNTVSDSPVSPPEIPPPVPQPPILPNSTTPTKPTTPVVPTSTPPKPITQAVPLDKVQVIKPSGDVYEYEMYEMKNKIKVLIASSPEIPQIGVAIGLKGVGTYQDPQDAQGLSHFAEHLLFMGSKNYTGADAILVHSEFRQGQINGMTLSNTTIYPFVYESLEDVEYCLTRYVDFVKYPLLAEQSMANELWAISSEYVNQQEQGSSQVEFVMKQLSNPEHPFHGFDVGSRQSLNGTLKNPLKTVGEYVQRLYTPENTYLVAITDTQLKDQTKQLLEKYFSQLENKKIDPKFRKQSDIGKAFSQNNTGQYIKVQTTSEINELQIVLPLQIENSKVTQSYAYIENIFQRLMTVSFCEYVTSHFYATDCSASTAEISDDEVYFSVVLALTQSGYKHQFELVRLFFAYFDEIKLQIHSDVLLKYSQKQQREMFDLQDNEDIFPYITNLAAAFVVNQNAHILDGEYDFSAVNASELSHILSQINPAGILIFLRSNFLAGQANKNALADEQKQFKGIINFITSNNSKSNFTASPHWNDFYSIYKLSAEEKKAFSLPPTKSEDIIQISVLADQDGKGKKGTKDKMSGDDMEDQKKIDESKYDEKTENLQILTDLKKNIQDILSQKKLPRHISKHASVSPSISQILNGLVAQKQQEEIKPILVQTIDNVNLWLLELNQIKVNLTFASFLLSNPLLQASSVSLLYEEQRIITFVDFGMLVSYLNIWFGSDLFASTDRGLSYVIIGEKENIEKFSIAALLLSFQEIEGLNFEDFEFLKEKVKNDVYRSRESSPIREMFLQMKDTLKPNHLSNEVKFQLLGSSQINFEDFLNWVERFKTRFNLEVFVGGKINRNEAITFLEGFLEKIIFTRIPDDEYGVSTYYAIPSGTSSSNTALRMFQKSYDLQNYCTVNYYQIGHINNQRNAKIMRIVSKYFEALSFYYLRTTMQMGYVVFSTLYNLSQDMYGLIFLVQGFRFTSQEFDLQIEKTISYVFGVIEGLPENADFDKIINWDPRRTQKINSIFSAYNNYWNAIIDGQFGDSNEEGGTTNQLKDEPHKEENMSITKAEVLYFFKEHLLTNKVKASFQGYNKYANEVLPSTAVPDEKIVLSQQKMRKDWKLEVYENKVSRKKQ